MADAIQIYAQICSVAIPFGLAFGICDLIVGAFMKMALGGKVEFK